MKFFFIDSQYGQLGNRLHTYLHGLAFCIKHGHTCVNLSFDKYAKYFQLSSVSSSNNLMLNASLNLRLRQFLLSSKLRPIRAPFIREIQGEPSSTVQSEDLLNRRPSREIGMVLRSWNFIASDAVMESKRVLRSAFSIKEEFLNGMRRPVKALGTINIGVHVRQGDYKTFLNGKYFYPMAAYRRYLTGVSEHYRSLGLIPCFYVVSDEKLSDEVFSTLNCTHARGTEIQDLALLAECDLIIGPPSSFSRWASWQADKMLSVMSSSDCDFDPNNNLNGLLP